MDAKPKRPISVWIAQCLFGVDVVARVFSWGYEFIFPESVISPDFPWTQFTVDLLLVLLCIAAFLAMAFRARGGLKLGIVVLVLLVLEIIAYSFIETFVDAFDFGIYIGLIAWFVVLAAFLIERFTRSRAVGEFFGILEITNLPELHTSPPPPPTFDS